MSTNLKIAAVGTLVACAIVGGICLEISIWNECRQANSFFYCMRVLGR
jgi:hypothetical protein